MKIIGDCDDTINIIYINPNTRALTSNYKNTVIKDKEAYNGAMLQHLLNPVEDLAQALKTPIKLAKGASLSRQNNSVNIAEGQSIRVNGGHVLTVSAWSRGIWWR